MAGGLVLRTVEVQNQQSYGTGCLVAPGLVLTAYHVALPGEGRANTVRDISSAGFTEAVVVWESPELDAVLLKADRDLVGAGLGVVRWGELVCDYPAWRPVCSMNGFPKAMQRRASSRPEQYVDDLKTVEGTIAPHTGSRSKLYALAVDGAVATEVTNWQGLSGAGVFCNGVLIGLARLVDRRWDRCLMVVPLSHLLAADGFVQAVAAHTAMPPRLQPADIRPLLDNAPDPTLSSTHLLDPRSQAVDLTGMSDLVHRIEQWCRSSDRIDVAAVTGLGGTGKSRLVTDVLHRLAATPGQRPWGGGFLAVKPSQPNTRSSPRPGTRCFSPSTSRKPASLRFATSPRLWPTSTTAPLSGSCSWPADTTHGGQRCAVTCAHAMSARSARTSPSLPQTRSPTTASRTST